MKSRRKKIWISPVTQLNWALWVLHLSQLILPQQVDTWTPGFAALQAGVRHGNPTCLSGVNSLPTSKWLPLPLFLGLIPWWESGSERAVGVSVFRGQFLAMCLYYPNCGKSTVSHPESYFCLYKSSRTLVNYPYTHGTSESVNFRQWFLWVRSLLLPSQLRCPLQ